MFAAKGISATATAAVLSLCTAGTASAATRNGDPDPRFGNGGFTIIDYGVDSTAFGLAVLADGRILLSSNVANSLPTNGDMGAARLLPNGQPDTSFSFDGRVIVSGSPGSQQDYSLNSIAQPDGKLLLVGEGYPVDSPAGGSDMVIVRLNTDGSLDTSFSGDGRAFVDFALDASSTDSALDAAIMPDGRIVVVGAAFVTGEERDFAIVMLNPDGTRDTSFDGDGRKTVRFELDPAFQADLATSVAIDSAGRILVAGISENGADNSHDFAIARLLDDGSLDSSFDSDGRASVAFDLGGNLDDEALELSIAADGSIFVTGVAMDTGFDAAVAKLFPDGTLDPSFGGDGRVTVPFDQGGNNNDTFHGSALLPDGGIVLSGFIATDTDTGDIALVRLRANGSLDPDFGFAGRSVIPMNTGGSNQDAATRVRWHNDTLIIGGATGDAGGYLNALAGRILIDVLFSDGHDGD